MSNDNDQIQKNEAPTETPKRVEPVRVHDDSTPGPVVTAAPPAAVAPAPAPAAAVDAAASQQRFSEPMPTPTPAPVAAAPAPVLEPTPAREDLYPRADGPVEADRDIPQAGDAPMDAASDAEDEADDDEDADEGPEVSVAIPLTGAAPASSTPAQPPSSSAPAAPGQPGAETREGGRRRR
ncbi:MAG: hypothetical protein Q8T11_12500, partial [Elusimicrobiota bacterium]|nr:hypothetical protein [Elusimicrobiota bacterium]